MGKPLLGEAQVLLGTGAVECASVALLLSLLMNALTFYLSFLALTALHFGWLTDVQVLAALNLGYILLLPFILFGGYAITLDSWAQAFHHGGFLNYGAAAWTAPLKAPPNGTSAGST